MNESQSQLIEKLVESDKSKVLRRLIAQLFRLFFFSSENSCILWQITIKMNCNYIMVVWFSSNALQSKLLVYICRIKCFGAYREFFSLPYCLFNSLRHFWMGKKALSCCQSLILKSNCVFLRKEVCCLLAQFSLEL